MSARSEDLEARSAATSELGRAKAPPRMMMKQQGQRETYPPSDRSSLEQRVLGRGASGQMNFFPIGGIAPLALLQFQPFPEGRKDILDLIGLVSLILIFGTSHWQRSRCRPHSVTWEYCRRLKLQEALPREDANCRRNLGHASCSAKAKTYDSCYAFGHSIANYGKLRRKRFVWICLSTVAYWIKSSLGNQPALLCN
jgi:hypothetical protein